MRNSFLYILFFILITVCSVAQHNLSDPLPIDPRVKIGKLSNGLTYYIQKNTRPERKVELRLVVNTGSILEDDDQRGLAHFTEHMAFNGSKNFQKNDLVSFLQSIGVKFGADLNAYTSFDETVYILPIPTEKKENIEKGFQILEDWASAVSFDHAEIDKERGVVLEELRLGKGADDRMSKIYFPKLFEGSKYGDRLPIGTEDVLKNFNYETIKKFYKDWYRPDLMAVIVVGDMEVAEAEQYIKKHFAHLKNPDQPRPRLDSEVMPRKKSEGIVATDKEATNHYVQIYYTTKKWKVETTVKDYRDFIIERIFTSMLSQRLQELTQKSNPPFLYGASNFGEFVRGYEAYSSFAVLGKDGVEPAINAIIQENERARKFGFTPSELDRIKKVLMKNIERSFNERDKTESSNLVQEYVRNFLEKEPIPGIENEYSYHKQYLDGITLEEVNQYAAKTIPPDTENKLVILTGPEKAEFKIPSNEELLTIADNAAKVEVTAYEENAVATSLMEKVPAPGKIVSEKVIKELNITELTLSNGVKVLLKPTDFKNDQIILASSRFGGQYLYDPKDRLDAEYASTIVTQMGIGQFSPLDLRKVLAGKSASITPRLGTISESLNGQCSAADLETMLQLTHLYFTQPRYDAELFKSFVTKQQAMYQNMSSDPQYTFQDSVMTILYRNHPWAPRVPKSEIFSKINDQHALNIYKERFGDANGFTFVLVGKFDVATIKPLLATYLGSLKSSSKKSTFKDVGLRPVKGVKKEIFKGTEPKSFIRMFWNGEATYSTDEQLKIQALTEVLNIKLIEKLREDLAGIYGGGMFGSLNKYPYNHFSLGASLPCGPENVDKLITATLEEIEKIKANGPAVEDLNKVKETWRQQHEVNLKENNFWARQLLQSIELGTDLQNVLSYEERIARLTPADVKSAANKYLDMKNYVQIVLNPEK
ncbi:M16 family metallopeptidase [Chryseolinea sp. H1M3-3]|uniref:M16 family metallopeptidase n=1 Tax=Chryseolinea sp. H1M3-3 TaxID=3034144 RepID=UPI0023EC0842|nr:M16 family metallopeptidase [Chryseolinea sp. H1M3-3]